MAGIAGITKPNKEDTVNSMLDKIAHRGNSGRAVFSIEGLTLGMVWPESENKQASDAVGNHFVVDGPGFGQQVLARTVNGHLELTRDELGVTPVYYAELADGTIAFSSEVKGLLMLTRSVMELMPGCKLKSKHVESYFELKRKEPVYKDTRLLASELLKLLDNAVRQRINSGYFGSWLSGGIDSSTLAALARPHVTKLYTFCAGLRDAPDFEPARAVARFIQADHHEIVLDIDMVLKAIPEVIYHLESFDALLVRSSVVNYLAAKAASGFCGEVFSGEGGDELFGGYHYLKSIPVNQLPDELIDIAKRLHNTAFQRVDRCASAHGTKAHVVFANPEVFEFALRTPAVMKIRDGVEKWILREAMQGLLPGVILDRPKAKFWEGAGIAEIISDHACKMISDADFQRERLLPCGWKISSREELFYYRYFKEHFGDFSDLGWMGRTKGAHE